MLTFRHPVRTAHTVYPLQHKSKIVSRAPVGMSSRRQQPTEYSMGSVGALWCTVSSLAEVQKSPQYKCSQGVSFV